MKHRALAVAAALFGAAFVVNEVEAKRTGGGRSVGAQRSVAATPPPQAVPARPAQQAAPAQQPVQQAAPMRQPAQQPAAAPAGTGSRWMPMLGGLALGGLLGALIGASGFGAMLLSWLAIAALVFGAIVLVRLLVQRRAPLGQPLQYAGLGNETVAAPPPSQAFGLGTPQAAPIRQPAAARVPAGFDVAGFLKAAKLNFMRLQAANDRGDLEELRELTTSELFEELKKDLAARGGAPQRTDVESLAADLLEVLTEGDRHWASVRFSGVIRETSAAAPEGFEEVWNLVKPTDGSAGWLLAGIQQMH